MPLYLIVTLDTGEVMALEIANSLREATRIDKAMFTDFVQDIIENASRHILHNPTG